MFGVLLEKYRQSQEVQPLGSAVTSDGFTFTVRDFNCVDTPPGAGSAGRAQRPTQTCTASISIRNNQNRVDSTTGFNSYLFVGDNRFPERILQDLSYLGRDLFPDSSYRRATRFRPTSVRPG